MEDKKEPETRSFAMSVLDWIKWTAKENKLACVLALISALMLGIVGFTAGPMVALGFALEALIFGVIAGPALMLGLWWMKR